MSNLLFSKHSLPGGARGLVVFYCDLIKISCGISGLTVRSWPHLLMLPVIYFQPSAEETFASLTLLKNKKIFLDLCSQSTRRSFKLKPGDWRKWFNPALACLSEAMTVWGKPFSEWSLPRVEQCPPWTLKPAPLPPPLLWVMCDRGETSRPRQDTFNNRRSDRSAARGS